MFLLVNDSNRIQLSANRTYGSSITGQREKDEDFIVSGEFDNLRIGILCDGMGGEEKGEVSSETVAKGFLKAIYSLYNKNTNKWYLEEFRFGAYKKIVEKCHDVVARIAGENKRSGTTLTAVILTYEDTNPKFADIIHIGDSRCYLIEDDKVELLTDDHTQTGNMYRAEYIELFEIPETAGNNVLTKHIGDEKKSSPDIQSITFSSNSIFLLCCDGVWGPLHTKEGLWLPNNKKLGQEQADEFVNYAIKKGSTDNCSVLILHSDIET